MSPMFPLVFFVGFILFMWIVPALGAGCDPFAMIGKQVYLTDTWGEVYKTKLRKDKNGILYANVHRFTQVGHVILNEDHTTSSIESSYIRTWSYLKPKKPKKPSKVDEATELNAEILKSRG